MSESCRQSAQPASHYARCGDGMECLHAPVPQFDRTMLRLCSAVQLGPFASQERTIEQCSPSCSTTAAAQQYGSRASAQIACLASHPQYVREDK